MKYIVITGVSTGIGYGSTKQFINKGYTVFGSVRKQVDGERLKIEFGSNFIPLYFDITDQLAIRKAVNIVKENIGNNGLTGLINNAGETEGAPLMHMQIDSFRKNLDVLVTGHLIVIQEFLPLLGAAKDYPYLPGRIINITSINGKLAAPFLGGYVAAKHAFEGLSNTLRIELQIYGIDVIIVRPGMVKTAIWGKSKDDSAELYKHTDFYLPGKRFNDFVKKSVPKEALECDELSKKLIKIFELKNPKTRYALVKNKFKNWTLPMMLSNRMLDKFFAKLIGLDRREL